MALVPLALPMAEKDVALPKLGAVSPAVTPRALTFAVRPKAGQLSLPVRAGSPTRKPFGAGPIMALPVLAALPSLAFARDWWAALPVGSPDAAIRHARSAVDAAALSSRSLARPQLVEHDHERLVGRFTIARDVELRRALRAADALCQDDIGLLIRPERETDAAEFRQSFGLRVSSNTCSKRSPRPHRRQRARFGNGHDTTPTQLNTVDRTGNARAQRCTLSEPDPPDDVLEHGEDSITRWAAPAGQPALGSRATATGVLDEEPLGPARNREPREVAKQNASVHRAIFFGSIFGPVFSPS